MEGYLRVRPRESGSRSNSNSGMAIEFPQSDVPKLVHLRLPAQWVGSYLWEGFEQLIGVDRIRSFNLVEAE